MTKQNLFNIVALFCAIGWFSHIELAVGFAWACWIVIVIIILNFLYSVSEEDPKEEDDNDSFFLN
jgi:hypothetical protein